MDLAAKNAAIVRTIGVKKGRETCLWGTGGGQKAFSDFQKKKDLPQFMQQVFDCAPGMARQLWGASPLWAVMCGTTSRRQLRHREESWEGSPRQDLGIDEQKPDTRPAVMG